VYSQFLIKVDITGSEIYSTGKCNTGTLSFIVTPGAREYCLTHFFIAWCSLLNRGFRDRNVMK
jgi:hypothetical protein